MADNWDATGGASEAVDDNATASVTLAPVVQVIPQPADGWTNPTAYDYTDNAPDKWDGNATVYEFDGDTGDLGPEHPELERQLFGEPTNITSGHGIDFSAITKIDVFQEGPVRVMPIQKFEDAGFHPAMGKNIALAKYTVPTPIQKYCIPAIKAGHDLIAIAQTGSGKTAAYIVPILDKLMGKAKKLAAPRPDPTRYRPGIDPPMRAEPLVLIVCPSRELAIQIFNEARKFCYRSMLRPGIVYGGGPVSDQIASLQKGCDILIGTAGRLCDFMKRPDVLTLRRVRFMVFDEADEWLHDDWATEFNQIMSGGDQEDGKIQYMFFSATFPKNLRDAAKEHLKTSHVCIRVGRAGSSHGNIKQNIVMVDPALKKAALFDLLMSLPPTRTIIFANSRRAVDEIDDFLFNKGVPCTGLHADRNQKEREASMRAFRAGTSPVLIASAGVAGRGIDVRNVMHVVNYDLPSMEHGGIEEYTHRIGRTGRIGHRGLATSFFTERDEPIASVLTRTLQETNQEIPDFLEQYKVSDGRKLQFEADSDFEDEEEEEVGAAEEASPEEPATEASDNGPW